MATNLLRRQLARAAPMRLAASTSTPSFAARRTLSSTAQAQAEPVTSQSGKPVHETHTVEDLHGMSASDILAETGTRRDAQMRHFTGEFKRAAPS